MKHFISRSRLCIDDCRGKSKEYYKLSLETIPYQSSIGSVYFLTISEYGNGQGEIKQHILMLVTHLCHSSNFKPLENTTKLLVFRCFQGGIKWEHWPEMGLSVISNDLTLGTNCTLQKIYLSKLCFVLCKTSQFHVHAHVD